ncbi:radical SAM protein [Candidatus Parcubacteria bacterium]|nr:radical SAM protein [Candidatus Parcubacteria bacterium]
MKLLLTNPNFKGVVEDPSLSFCFIGTYVKEHSNCEVEIIEPTLQGVTEKQLLAKMKESDILGLTCYTESRFQVFDFARKAKEVNPNCKIVIGGPHVYTLDKEILEYYPFVDFIVRGEGEETILEIIEGKPAEKILGIAWRKNSGEVVRNPDRPLISNIDNLHCDYSLILPQVKGWKELGSPYELQKLNNLPVIASRGCPFHCTFCAAHELWGKRYRGFSPEELVRRLKKLSSDYNIGYFRFYDALFTANDERILKFCDLLKKSNLKIRFRIDIRAGTSREVLKKLKEVGCDVVGFGVESGSDKILQRINKMTTRKLIEETIKTCKELGYWIHGFFMVSLPDETLEDFEKTFELFKSFDEMNIQFFKIHPNTIFYNELKQKGEINDEVWFNPDYGFKTKYGSEVYYCKEMFPSANFYRKEVEILLHRVNYNYIIYNRQKTIRKYGLTKGIFIISLSIVMDGLLKNGTGRKLYFRLEKANIPKRFYNWFTKRKKEN